MNIDFVNIKQF